MVEAVGDVRLVVPDEVSVTANQVALAANIRVESTGGDVALLGGDVFPLTPGHVLRAKGGTGQVTIGIDWLSADTGTTTFTVPTKADAIILAGELRIVGNRDTDVLIVPDLFMPVTFEGQGGDDSVDGTLTRVPTVGTVLKNIDIENIKFKHNLATPTTWVLDTEASSHQETLFSGAQVHSTASRISIPRATRSFACCIRKAMYSTRWFPNYRFGTGNTNLTVLAMRHGAKLDFQNGSDRVTVGGFRGTTAIDPGKIERPIVINGGGGTDTFELVEPRSGDNIVPIGRIGPHGRRPRRSGSRLQCEFEGRIAPSRRVLGFESAHGESWRGRCGLDLYGTRYRDSHHDQCRYQERYHQHSQTDKIDDGEFGIGRRHDQSARGWCVDCRACNRCW